MAEKYWEILPKYNWIGSNHPPHQTKNNKHLWNMEKNCKTHTHTSFVSLTANRCSSKIYGNKSGGNSRKARQLHLKRMRFCHSLLEVLQFNQELARDLRKSQWCFNRVTFWPMVMVYQWPQWKLSKNELSTDLFLTAPKKMQESKTTENYKNIKMEAK